MDSASSIHNLPSSLRCELKIIRANHLDFIPPGNIFIRSYLSTSTGKRIRLDSRETPSTRDPCWNQSFTLQCHSAATSSLEELKRQSVVFELRWRCSIPILDTIVGSKLLGRAEIEWKDMHCNQQRWFIREMDSNYYYRPRSFGPKTTWSASGVEGGSFGEGEKESGQVKELEPMRLHDGGCNYRDEEIFAIAATLETS